MKQRLVPILTLGVVLVISGLTVKLYSNRRQDSSATSNSAAPVEAITTLYRDYLNSNKSYTEEQAARNRLRTMMSPLLNRLIDQNQLMCERKVRGEICGWIANGNPFLNAQDWGDDLRFENSHFSISSIPVTQEQMQIDVSLELMPASPAADSRTRRLIRFHFVQTDGKWSISNMQYGSGNGTVRKETMLDTLRAEIAYLESLPDLK